MDASGQTVPPPDTRVRRIDFATAPLANEVGTRTGGGVASDGREGTLVYGPYWALPAGHYTLRCCCAPGGGGHAELNAWHSFAQHRLVSADLRGSVTEVGFTLLEEAANVEFVVRVGPDTQRVFSHFELIEGAEPPLPAGGRPALRSDFRPHAPFRHVMGLGTHCYSASFLHRVGWRHFAGPFDWLFASPEMVIHCIEDDFATLLDMQEYEPVPVEQRPDPRFNRCHHRFYRQHYGRDFVFNHHDVWTEEGHAYLRRAVDRFRALARGEVPVLLLASSREADMTVAQFRNMARCVAQHFPAGVLNAVVVTEPSEGALPEVELVAREGEHMMLRYRPIGVWEATAFREQLDERSLAEVLSLHRLELG